MTSAKVGAAHALAPSTVGLARAAAVARYRDMDAIAATRSLTAAASAWIGDSDRARRYLSGNLEAGGTSLWRSSPPSAPAAPELAAPPAR